MEQEHLEKLMEIQHFALEKACYIKSEINKHEPSGMSTCMWSQALDDLKDCVKIIKDCQTTIAMVREPSKLNPTMVK